MSITWSKILLELIPQRWKLAHNEEKPTSNHPSNPQIPIYKLCIIEENCSLNLHNVRFREKIEKTMMLLNYAH